MNPSLSLMLISAALLATPTVFAQDAPAAPESTDATHGDEDSSTSADVALSSEPLSAPTCFPACRRGFLCHAGLCVPACNPPCANGQECGGDGECTALPAPPQPEPRDTLRHQERTARQQAKAERAMWMQVLRITLNTEWSWLLSEELGMRSGFLAAVGIQQNVTPFFGLRGRLGGEIGYLSDAFIFDGNKSLSGAVHAEMTPYFGPMGRFCIGPVAWFSWYMGKQRSSSLYDDPWYDDDYRYGYTDGPAGGLGIDMGILLGDQSNVGINWRIKGAILPEYTIAFQFGFTYHFLTGP